MKFNTAEPFFYEDDIKIILEEIRKILQGKNMLSKGPSVKVFESLFTKYIGTNYGVAVNSGTSALELVIKSIGLKEGDEVIVPVQTFVSTASSVVNNKGVPIFCGIDENYLIDIDELKTKITKKTKAVIIVHFCGLIHPEIFKLRDFLKLKKIFLIEDAAHAHGASIEGVKAGNIGDFGCFSFFSTKIMTTGGEGGFISTNHKKYFEICSSLSAIGIDKKSKTELYRNSGSNNRMTEIQSIIGICQLKKIDSFILHRENISNIYKEQLAHLSKNRLVTFQEYPKTIRHPFWRFLVIIRNNKFNRNKIKEEMGKVGVNIDWPYQPLLHRQPLFDDRLDIKEGDFLKSESLSNIHFSLPIHLKITEKNAIFISKNLLKQFV